MNTILNHFWIILIAATVANAVILKVRSKKYIAENPDLAEGYDKYIKGLLLYGNIPWVIMMIGNLSGSTQYVFEYFNPKAMNPVVLTFHFSIIVLWILSVRWIYFKKGAEFIEKHPGLFYKSSFSGKTNPTAKQIKISFPFMLLGGIAGMIFIWTLPFPQ